MLVLSEDVGCFDWTNMSSEVVESRSERLKGIFPAAKMILEEDKHDR